MNIVLYLCIWFGMHGFTSPLPSVLSTEKLKSFCIPGKGQLTLSPGAKVALPSAAAQGAWSPEIINGRVRWRSSVTHGPVLFKTKTATMGVRGTDFVASFDGSLLESEIIVLDGTVEMNRALIHKGQWGGVGGRFGARIGPILTLPKSVLDQTNAALTPEAGQDCR